MVAGRSDSASGDNARIIDTTQECIGVTELVILCAVFDILGSRKDNLSERVNRSANVTLSSDL